MNFSLKQKPVSAHEMRVARAENHQARSVASFDHELSSLKDLLESAKSGEASKNMSPVALVGHLARGVASTQKALTNMEVSYQDKQNIKTLGGVIQDVAAFLSGAEDVQTGKLDNWNAAREEIVGSLGSKVSENIDQALLSGAKDGAIVSGKPDGTVWQSSEFKEAAGHVQRGFENAVDGNRKDMKTDIHELLGNLTTIADEGVEKWSGFHEIGNTLGSVLSQIAEMEGDEFKSSAKLLKTYMEPTGLIYGQIAKAGRDLGSDFADQKSARADAVNDLSKGLGFASA